MKDLESEFERMVRENRSTIYTVCYMFSNDQDEVADLFQEVLINLWKSLPSFEERGDVRSWIYRISLNVCISLDRKKHRHKTVPLTMDIDPYEEVETNQNSRQMEMLRQFAKPDASSLDMLRMAMERLKLSARAYSRILKVARTIADLEGSEKVQSPHIAEAIGYRNLDRGDWAERGV